MKIVIYSTYMQKLLCTDSKSRFFEIFSSKSRFLLTCIPLLFKNHLVTLSIPYTKRSQALCIPQEILIKYGVSQERVLRAIPEDKGVEECIFEVATAAHQHLEHARNLSSNLPKVVRKIFLPAVAVERYLERLRLANFNLVHQSCLQRDSMLPLALYMRNLRGKF